MGAERSPIRETPGRAGSSADKAGTAWYCQTGRVFYQAEDGIRDEPVSKPRDLTLAMARQGDLETWLASAQATHRTDAGNFVRWARRHKLTSLDFAAIRLGRADRCHRHRGPLGTSPLAAARQHTQTRRPRRRPARPALRPMAGHDQPAHPQPYPGQRRAGAHPARPRAGHPPRATRRPGPPSRRRPARPRRRRQPPAPAP